MSSVGSATFKLSIRLVKILSPHLESISGFHLINCNDLLNKLNSLSVHSNVIFVSFVPCSWLTKVSIDDILNYFSEELQNQELKLPSNATVNLVSLCIKDCTFTFSNKYSQQTLGIAMSNPPSPLLSNFHMEFFE